MRNNLGVVCAIWGVNLDLLREDALSGALAILLLTLFGRGVIFIHDDFNNVDLIFHRLALFLLIIFLRLELLNKLLTSIIYLNDFFLAGDFLFRR